VTAGQPLAALDVGSNTVRLLVARLAGGRLERWIIGNQSRYNRGVFLAVGDAFTLLSGRRPFAPKWMQRLSLTWLFRLLAEPRRLGPRYLRYNSLFVYYFLRDWLLGPPAPGVE